MNVAASIGECEAIPFDVREALEDFGFLQPLDVLGRREALSSSGISLENVLLLVKSSHAVHYRLFTRSILLMTEEPDCVILQLRIGVVQESHREVPPRVESPLQDRVHVAQEIGLLRSTVVVLL